MSLFDELNTLPIDKTIIVESDALSAMTINTLTILAEDSQCSPGVWRRMPTWKDADFSIKLVEDGSTIYFRYVGKLLEELPDAE